MKLYIVSAVAAVFLWIGFVPIKQYALQDEVTFTVSKTERVNYSNNSKYLVWSKEGDVYENIDTVWFLKWNSSDVQGQLLPETKVKAHITGLRFGFFSWYPNIISVEKIDNN